LLKFVKIFNAQSYLLQNTHTLYHRKPKTEVYKEQSGKPGQIIGMRIQYFEAES